MRPPARPRWTPIYRNVARRIRYREWKPFLSVAEAAYWNTELID
jgi:hypothetical protein